MEDKIRIIPYQPELAAAFRELNLAWIEKFFVVEEEDRRMLDQPEEIIINKGGAILFAVADSGITGTCALVKIDEQTYELAKMAVKEEMQGRKIGQLIGEAIISLARSMGAKKIILDTNSSLTPALKLYEKLGFIYIPITPDQNDRYRRADVMMELII